MNTPVPQAACSRCGTGFTCGMEAGQPECWCSALPHLATLDPDTTCLCQTCLLRALGNESEATMRNARVQDAL